MHFLLLIFALMIKNLVAFIIFIKVLMRDLELLSLYWLGKLRILLPSALGTVYLNIASAENINSSDKKELEGTKKISCKYFHVILK